MAKGEEKEKSGLKPGFNATAPQVPLRFIT